MTTKQWFKVVREPVLRLDPAENVTLGKMYLDNVFFSQSCEDEDRFLERSLEAIDERKVYGRTAIPRGRYRLLVTFSNRFQKPLPVLLDVPGFEGIRIHGGNRAEDSHGCILVGKVRTAVGIAQCKDTVQRVISQIEAGEEMGIETWIDIE